MREAVYAEHNQQNYYESNEERDTEKEGKNNSRCSSGLNSKVTADRTTISKRS